MPVEIDIEHVARLARLELTDEEKARLREQLGVILEAAAKVSEVATDDVPPTAYAIARSNVLRPDEITPSLTTEEVLSNAPEVEDDRFKVPRVVEVEWPSCATERRASSRPRSGRGSARPSRSSSRASDASTRSTGSSARSWRGPTSSRASRRGRPSGASPRVTRRRPRGSRSR